MLSNSWIVIGLTVFVASVGSSPVRKDVTRGLPAFIIGEAIIAGTDEVAKYITDYLKSGRSVVSVANDMADTIAIKCMDANVNLGVHEITPGDAYLFTFKPNIWGTTHYWCTAFTNTMKKAPFPVYNEGAPTETSNVFRVKEEGVHLNDKLHKQWFAA